MLPLLLKLSFVKSLYQNDSHYEHNLYMMLLCVLHAFFEPVDEILKHQRSDDGKTLTIATCTLRKFAMAVLKAAD